MLSSWLAEECALARYGECRRKTKETEINVKLNLDGAGNVMIETGIPFFDHMLELLFKHALIDAEVKAKGDLEVDYHHTVEDTGIAIGEAINDALGEKKGITRFGWSLVPMDESLAEVAIDVSGRPFLAYKVNTEPEPVGNFDPRLSKDFFTALSNNSRITVHINLRSGGSVHHSLEAVFKAFGRALKMAVEIDPRILGIPSTKGAI